MHSFVLGGAGQEECLTHAPLRNPLLPCSLLEVIRPLGLPSVRLAAVQGLATGFLGADWEDPAEFKHWCACVYVCV